MSLLSERELAAVPSSQSRARAGLPVLVIFTVTMFVSATLLFMVQPMFARMVLPLLGGSPAVWNTTVVFYQAALLAGYAYAHLSTRWLGRRHQVALHALLLLLPLLVLPIGVPAGWSPPTADNPIPWLMALLLVTVGLPFFVVSTSSPLLQTWFAGSGHRSAADPYFLYAASNAGSMLALLSYPLLVEPYLRLAGQSWMWACGYGVLVLLTLLCAAAVWRTARTENKEQRTKNKEPRTEDRGWKIEDGPGAARVPSSILHPPSSDTPSVVDDRWSAQDNTHHASRITYHVSRITASRRVRWVLLAFVPSSLMLSVTTYLSTNIAPIPLLWIIPLALYLLTFILVFAGKPLLPHGAMVRALPIVLLPLVIVICAQATQPIWMMILLHVLTFFVATMVCHGEMAADRPPPQHLTEFYLWMSIGGVLGGLFNALLAPLLFTTVVEYPLVLVLACLLRTTTDDRRPTTDRGDKEKRRNGEKEIGDSSSSPSPSLPLSPSSSSGSSQRSVVSGRWSVVSGRWSWLDLALPLAIGALVAGLIVGLGAAGVQSGPLAYGLMFGVPVALCFSFSRRPLRFALAVGAIFLASGLYTSDQGQVLHVERSFFGIHRVLLSPDGRFHMIAHGGTLHGKQSLDPARSREPISYYYTNGPVGQLFAASIGTRPEDRVAVVGLGAGSLACYQQPGQQWTFYEIDPVVERIARDERYFTFLRDCAPGAPVVLGDARLSLAGAPDSGYTLMFLDAYSSDSTPIHLITREALALYLAKLAPDGVLAFHISNQYLDLRPVLGDLAQDAGLVCLSQDDLMLSEEESRLGKSASQWVVMARDQADLGALTSDQRWRPLAGRPGASVWTDDFSSILDVLRWR